MHGNGERARGSALLIVLGFLSFMVVSAVAFSVFMRTERAPSSVFRRGVVTRHLLHAGLARAIAKVDDAIRDDPFPGVYSEDPHKAYGNRLYDKWLGRVFMQIEPQYDGVWDYENKNRNSRDGDYPRDDNERIVPKGRIGETVPVLNLEALGYVPPALINDVRYLSRLSWSSKWEYFNFNAGRYAYVAVNVSDYFDVNSMPINEPRSMSAPISIDYLFQSGNKLPATVKKTASIDASALTQVADFLENRGSGGADFPFVSMLDYALAAGKNNVVALPSPFYEYASGKSSTMYSGAGAGANDDIARQMFIAGSSVAVTSAADRVTLTKNRNDPKCGQPFRDLTDSDMEGGLKPWDIIGNLKKPALKAGQNGYNYFSVFDWIALYDYLDRDDVPTSLVVPTVERVPMITGIGPDFGVNAHIMSQEGPLTEESGGDAPSAYKEVTYYLAPDTIERAALRATLVFPFKRGEKMKQNFKIQAAARVFFMHKSTSGDLKQAGMVRAALDVTDEMLRPSKALWKNKSSSVDDCTITMVSDIQDLSEFPSGGIEEEQDAVFKADILFDNIPSDYSSHPLYVIRTYYSGTKDPDTGVITWDFEHPVKKSGFYGGAGRFKFIGANWDVNAFAAEKEVKILPDNEKMPEDEFVPSVAVWVRVLDGSGKFTLDLVPATVADDNLNDVNNLSDALRDDLFHSSGSGIPLLRFTPQSATPVLTYDDQKVQDVASPQAVELYPKGVYAVDPRYNFAPEDWFESSSAIDEKGWLQNAILANGSEGRQGDIFFFVSNQGYLQSMAELAFLPRTGNLDSAHNTPFGASNNGYNGALRGSRTEIANLGLAWKTYHAFDENGADSDYLFELGIEDGNETALRVNPYSGDPNIRLAAFANTPYDWWVAGTNTTTSSSAGQNSKDPSEKQKIDNSASARLDYSFNEKSSEARIKYEDISGIANYIYGQFGAEDNRNKSWEQVFDDLQWSSGQDDELFGIKLEHPLHDVDRKFLYGFWRNCFANQQQLFLIFVRAESTALGGAGEGGTPAQLGGRAVALVWRDPNPPLGDHQLDRTLTRDDSGYERRPHKTRVLFYHQFE